jgi:hypothetical protein
MSEKEVLKAGIDSMQTGYKRILLLDFSNTNPEQGLVYIFIKCPLILGCIDAGSVNSGCQAQVFAAT